MSAPERAPRCRLAHCFVEPFHVMAFSWSGYLRRDAYTGHRDGGTVNRTKLTPTSTLPASTPDASAAPTTILPTENAYLSV